MNRQNYRKLYEANQIEVKINVVLTEQIAVLFDECYADDAVPVHGDNDYIRNISKRKWKLWKNYPGGKKLMYLGIETLDYGYIEKELREHTTTAAKRKTKKRNK